MSTAVYISWSAIHKRGGYGPGQRARSAKLLNNQLLFSKLIMIKPEIALHPK